MSETWAIPLVLLVLGTCGAFVKWLASRTTTHGEQIAQLSTTVEGLDAKFERLEGKLDRLLER